MTTLFKTIDPGGGTLPPNIFRSADGNDVVANADFDWLVTAEDDAVVTKGRIFVTARKGVGLKGHLGWIEHRFLSEPLPPDEVPLPPNPFRVDLFVATCATNELSSATGGALPTFSTSADFMIALALMESELKDVEKSTADGGIGPYRFTSARWERFVADHADTGFDGFGRFLPLRQIQGASYYCAANFHAFRKLAEENGTADPAQAFVPSFLDLLHCWTLTPEAAFRLTQEDGAKPVKPIVDAAMDADPEVKARLDRLLTPINDMTVADFVDATRNLFEAAAEEAFQLLRKHAAAFVPKPSAAAPWMAVAEREAQDWAAELRETDPDGRKKVKEFFGSMGIDTDEQLA